MKFQKMAENSKMLAEMIHGIVLTLDPNSTIVTCNSYLENITGYSSSVIIEKNWYDLFVSADPRISSKDYFHKEILKSDTHRCVNTIQSQDGKTLFFEWNLKPVRDSNGKILRVLGIGQDISERIMNEGQLLKERFELTERNKELTCLYGISKIIENRDSSFGEKLQAITYLLPPAFQYPETASACICLDDQMYYTAEYAKSRHRLIKTITVRGKKRGSMEVVYSEKKKRPGVKKSCFLKEEHHLLKSIARQLSLILEKKEIDDKMTELEEQLRHADRLSTIGQFAAGIAHEINNPLGDILGFAQLAVKCPDLPEKTYADLDHIVKSSLYAREIIKKIMFFCRQMPHKNILINLNLLIEEWLHFIKSCSKQDAVEVILDLDLSLPVIQGDPSQLNQVFVNLSLNAIHAMPKGGTLTIETRKGKRKVYFIIKDTGIGMSEETLNQIFMPFFTTKDVDQGTGLGLSVVHGIVESHGGTIKVDSRQGKGTQFTIELPATYLEKKDKDGKTKTDQI